MTLASKFLLALGLSLLVTPIISRFACKNGLTDNPGVRKIHRYPRPLLGGVSIFFALSFAVLYFYPFSGCAGPLLLCSLLIVILGLIDDLYDLKPLYKLAGQIAAAVIYILFSAGSYGPLLDALQKFHLPPPVALALFIFWIVLLTNAFNLIDGLDGLSGGIAGIIFAALALLAFWGGHLPLLGLLLIGLGAVLGFLPYNYQPARIFLGDAGAMLLGFILAALHLLLLAASPVSGAMLPVSALIFAYPIIDVAFAVLRRLRMKRPIFQGDLGHIHHLLPQLGLSERLTVLLLYLGSAVFAALALLLFAAEPGPAALVFLGAALTAGAAALFHRLLSLGGPRRLVRNGGMKGLPSPAPVKGLVEEGDRGAREGGIG